MLDTITSEAGVFATGIGLFIAISGLFYKADEYFSKEFKDDVALWLLCLEPQAHSNSWSIYFTELFDKLFLNQSQRKENGAYWRKFFNIKTFLKSCLASIIAMVAISLIYLTVGPGDLSWIDQQRDITTLYVLLVLALILNLIPDYLSLLQTRYFLNLIGKRESYLYLVTFLLLDAMVTAGIFLIIGMFLGVNILLILLKGEFVGTEGIEVMASSWKEMMWFDSGIDGLFGIFFYSTFFTSVWLWLFGASNLALNSFSKAKVTVSFLKYALPIEERPFRAIGIVAGLISVTIYWIFSLTKNLA